MQFKLEWRLGPSREAVPPPALPSPDGPAADPRAFVDTTIVDIQGQSVIIGIPPYDLDTHRHLVEVRAYLVEEGGDRPADAQGYVDSGRPFGHADVSGQQAGAEVPIALPDVPPAAYLLQVLEGYAV